MAMEDDDDGATSEISNPEISNVQIGELLAPALGVKGARLDLVIDGRVSDEQLKEVLDFAREAKGLSRIDLSIDLSDKSADFKNRVVGFLDRLGKESTQVSINARSSGPNWRRPPPPPPKPPRPIHPTRPEDGPFEAPEEPEDL